ncbi:hypothetical protein [Mycolicibacterium sphagni]|uniref:DNA-binding protein n=1 Tax=Mycolicibacterium sphagni TaxID=1786 RepID=A0A255DM18_9MYCO|nr:hypothetical protein [Mycolicibacterium sphagni]OYN80438.1 hypothetical protein CG716_09955 [Mycolicibacterium sphagni]
MSWEEKLQRLVALLWEALPEASRSQLLPAIHQLGAAWALPDSEAQPIWMTTVEVALEFKLSPASIRSNWPRQYGIRPTNDRWLREDVELVRLKRRLKGHVA